MKSPRFPPAAYYSNPLSDAEEGNAPGTRFVEAPTSGVAPAPKPFALQPPPIKIHSISPKTSMRGFDMPIPPAPRAAAETNAGHAPVAPGEQQYAAVPIPSAYQPASPGPAQQTFGFQPMPGQAMTSEHRIESPPSSPRLPRAAPRFA
jgi:hypothetical protein